MTNGKMMYAALIAVVVGLVGSNAFALGKGEKCDKDADCDGSLVCGKVNFDCSGCTNGACDLTYDRRCVTPHVKAGEAKAEAAAVAEARAKGIAIKGRCPDETRCHEGKWFEESCADGVDNDHDGFMDQSDLDCRAPEVWGSRNYFGVQLCKNHVDDDGDGLADELDPDCHLPERKGMKDPDGVELCLDGKDNDGDGYVDQNDLGCQPEGNWAEPECHDGLDNDEDGYVDKADIDCLAPAVVTGRYVSGVVELRVGWIGAINQGPGKLVRADGRYDPTSGGAFGLLCLGGRVTKSGFFGALIGCIGPSEVIADLGSGFFTLAEVEVGGSVHPLLEIYGLLHIGGEYSNSFATFQPGLLGAGLGLRVPVSPWVLPGFQGSIDLLWDSRFANTNRPTLAGGGMGTLTFLLPPPRDPSPEPKEPPKTVRPRVPYTRPPALTTGTRETTHPVVVDDPNAGSATGTSAAAKASATTGVVAPAP